MRLRLKASAVLLVLAACARGGCGACGKEPLARLTDTQGAVERDFASAVSQWTEAQAGARFENGDGLRTAQGAEATLQVARAGKVVVQSETTIRFGQGRPNSAERFSLEVVAGTATLIAGAEAMNVGTRFGNAVIAAGSSVRLGKEAHGLRYEVLFGRATFPTRDGQRIALTKGQVFEIEIGLAQLESTARAASEVAPATPDTLAPTEPGDAGARDAGNKSTPSPAELEGGSDSAGVGLGLDYAELTLRAGASATIYDPKPPTAIGFAVEELCPEGAIVRVGAGKRARSARGTAQINLALSAGTHDYRVVCGGADANRTKAAATGTLYIERKSGTDQLPRSAPINDIDLDGRRYTAMFQNLAPAIRVRWPKAPPAARYVLHASLANGKTLALPAGDPALSLAPGEIPEGENRLYFEVAGDGTTRSWETLLVVKFDNAAPTASLRLPPANGFAAGPSVQVEGVALASSTVSVNGQALPLDSQHRFSAAVPLAAGARALAVKIDHPRTGARYYIRRPLGGQ
jgi:hypothetical protein